MARTATHGFIAKFLAGFGQRQLTGPGQVAAERFRHREQASELGQVQIGGVTQNRTAQRYSPATPTA